LLAPFALRPALPAPAAGRHARDYYEASAPPCGPRSGIGPTPPPGLAARTGGEPQDGSHVHHAIDRSV